MDYPGADGLYPMAMIPKHTLKTKIIFLQHVPSTDHQAQTLCQRPIRQKFRHSHQDHHPTPIDPKIQAGSTTWGHSGRH
jgi:hypothetical protein